MLILNVIKKKTFFFFLNNKVGSKIVPFFKKKIDKKPGETRDFWVPSVYFVFPSRN